MALVVQGKEGEGLRSTEEIRVFVTSLSPRYIPQEKQLKRCKDGLWPSGIHCFGLKGGRLSCQFPYDREGCSLHGGQQALGGWGGGCCRVTI